MPKTWISGRRDRDGGASPGSAWPREGWVRDHGDRGEDQLNAFSAWLRERRLARDHQIPHMVRWVERFRRLRTSRPREAWHDTLRVFLEDLHDSDAPDWQIRQAGDAVSLYCGQFTKHSQPGLVERPSRPDAVPNDPGGLSASPAVAATDPTREAGLARDPDLILQELARILRLRHYSPRTQQCYLGWARRYLGYHRATSSGIPSAVSPNDSSVPPTGASRTSPPHPPRRSADRAPSGDETFPVPAPVRYTLLFEASQRVRVVSWRIVR